MNRQRGFVLIVVLGMTMLIAVLLCAFYQKCRSTLFAAQRFQQSEQALNCARAGLNTAIAAIADGNNSCPDKSSANPTASQYTLSFGQGRCSVNICDESGKFNINLLVTPDGRPDKARINQLLHLIDVLNRQGPQESHIRYGIAPAVIDWIDRDDDVTSLPFVHRDNLGAESTYYRTLNPPYTCKSAPLDVLDEMLLIRGVTPQVFERLSPYLTTAGDGKTNINSAPRPIIEALAENMDPALAQIIERRRTIQPFQSVTELRDIPGMTDEIFRLLAPIVSISGAEGCYRVTSQGTYETCTRTIIAILRRNQQAENLDIVLCREL